MNKSELVSVIAEKMGVSKKEAEAATNAFISTVTTALTEGRKIQLVGFGTFEVRTREARMGRNPRTGETMEIAASKVPAFKASSALKNVVNEK